MDIRIKDLCQSKGITQKALAQQLGVSEKTLSVAAKGNTSLQLLEQIAEALSVSVSELFDAPKEGFITCPHCGKSIALHPSAIDK